MLNVNRNTGAISINTGPAPVSIDGYAIRSPLGGLVPGNWNSLQDQGVSDWRESPPGGAAIQLAELKPTSSTAIAPGAPRALGNVFAYPAAQEFGTELEDIAFEYYTTDGRVVQGLVNYEGDKRFNNLVLVVDPASGATRLENQSTLSVDIDGYKITSASGSLLPANGNWNSLDDQNAAGGDWRESNPTVNQLVELKPSGEALFSGGTNFNMGSLFKTTAAGGTQDLIFEYLIPDDSEFHEGVVVYRSLASLQGDYNMNGVVDAADYVVWRNSIGTPAAYNTWRANFGRTAASGSLVAASTSVPEPASLVLVIAAACPLVMRRRRVRLLAKMDSPQFEADLRTEFVGTFEACVGVSFHLVLILGGVWPMMWRNLLVAICVLCLSCTAHAAVTSSVETDKAPAGAGPGDPYTPTFPSGGPSSTDILQGRLPSESAGNFQLETSAGVAALDERNRSNVLRQPDGQQRPHCLCHCRKRRWLRSVRGLCTGWTV